MTGGPQVLFSEAEIAERVDHLAAEIARLEPEIAVAILVGGFVFASDLVRALGRRSCDVAVEFLWLRSYGDERAAGAISLLAGPSENVRGKRALLIDGVLDVGRTIVKAQELLAAAGARAITTAVAIDKARSDAIASADFAAFTGVADFIVGYGMDDAGRYRGLPYIGVAGRKS
ncbi:MAG: hypoxanthine phosphoribosyltransferase [Alphaproteobacteria bacterium]|nr:hypoxanthine phosphoribosyltransferase [Alphaproteobacteria bacterium]